MTRPTCEGWWEYIFNSGHAHIKNQNNVAWIDGRDMINMIEDHEYLDGFIKWTGRYIDRANRCYGFKKDTATND